MLSFETLDTQRAHYGVSSEFFLLSSPNTTATFTTIIGTRIFMAALKINQDIYSNQR